ncbi:hypothetical protein V0U79_06095 [Hyphobacterium sp. HN65]|uniref:Uncharacterized protein n=1 Tax=Hyphobacterium lacteum TaxID=3116575 RepID=A0ABU7LPV5_9PROT|nr:hypothetical protein [Hyphobacterium sp. HN65]MEE2525930.1 hypothetical protein [Hyphobacterium sp. HN65]
MILQNISRAVRTQNWFAVAIEFVIVVAGVVIGFQINGWNADRVERAREAVILCRLDEEFARIEADVLQHVVDAESTLSEAQALRDDALRGLRLEQIGEYSERVVTLRAPPAGSATYDELVSSGEMGLIRSRRLREALIDYGESAHRFEMAGVNDAMFSSAGVIVQTIGLTEQQIETLTGPLGEELEALVTSGEFMLATQAMARIAETNLYWKQLLADRAQAVTARLAAETAHCGDAS